MIQNIFNAKLFENGSEPLPNQVFDKKFDAYFFLEYPPFQYNPTEVFNPFFFLNNIRENTIYVQNPDGSKTLSYTVSTTTWDVEPFNTAFNEQLGAERFLFWSGQNEKWGMVSDNTSKVAIFGIDWDISDQIPLFFQQCLLSPSQIIERLKIENQDVFLKNYAPASILTQGNAQNPMWIKYYFQCHVENENDKLFYWTQFEKLYDAMTQLLLKFKGLDMYACQSFDRRYKQNGTIYSSGKFAPVGGWQNYTFDNCKKVATKFLSQNQHLQLKFEGKTKESEDLYMASKTGLIGFMNFWLYANLEKTKTKGQASDFYFLLDNYHLSDKNQTYNQGFQFSYRKDLLSAEAVEIFINVLISIGFVKKIHRLEQPRKYAEYSPNQPLMIEGMYGAMPDLVTDNDLFQEIL